MPRGCPIDARLMSVPAPRCVPFLLPDVSVFHFLDTFGRISQSCRQAGREVSRSERGSQDPPCKISLRDTSRKKRNTLSNEDSLWRYSRSREDCSLEESPLSREEAVQQSDISSRLPAGVRDKAVNHEDENGMRMCDSGVHDGHVLGRVPYWAVHWPAWWV